MSELKIDCAYCPPDTTLLASSPGFQQDEMEWRKAWKRAAQNSEYMHIECSGCGATFALADDGTAPEQDGLVTRENVSMPRIDSLTIGSGSRTGGEALYIMGSALDVGSLVVKFNGTPVQQVTNRTATQARVVTPVGQYTLNVDQIITGTFIVGEEVRGQSSGCRAVVKSLSPFVVSAPTQALSPFEEVHGVSSTAQLRLQANPYSGAVDVTVENEYGKRLVGGTLVGGFIYA